MIPRDEFDVIMADLAEVFVPLTERGMDIYFRYLSPESPLVLRRAVSWLLENHSQKRFPYLAEITDSCRDLKRSMGEGDGAGKEANIAFGATIDTALCPCGGTGYRLKEHEWPDGSRTAMAHYCTCDRGQRMKAGHDKYFAWKRRRSEGDDERRYGSPPVDYKAEAANDFTTADERGRALEEHRDGLWERRKNDE